MGITMFKFRRIEQQPFLFQIRQNHRVRFFTKYPFIIGFFRHLALRIHQLYKRQVIIAPYIGIILTESRGNMNHSRTVCQRYVGIAGHIERFFMLLFAGL